MCYVFHNVKEQISNYKYENIFVLIFQKIVFEMPIFFYYI